MKKTLFGLIFLSIIAIPFISYAQEENPFNKWLDELKTEAKEKGYKEESIRQAFSEIKEPVKRVVKSDRNQAEVVETYADYLKKRVSEWRKKNGKKFMQKHEALLNEIGKKYGVQPRFIVAIWGAETNFGTIPLKEPVFSALATLAYDKRRAEFYRAQFFFALEILDKGFQTYEKMKGSWAGAMGQCQFLPESYLRYAVDYDNDGIKDIWSSEADVFASIANYLSSFGWRDNETWGRPVLLPDTDESELFIELTDDLDPPEECARYKDMGAWRDLQKWQELGIRRLNETDLPERSIPAALLLADKGDKKGYIIYRDFCTIMKFNPAFKYALSIGLLSDRISR